MVVSGRSKECLELPAHAGLSPCHTLSSRERWQYSSRLGVP